MKTFKDVHQCSQSVNKIVMISVDKVGVTKCGYCHEVVDMRPLTEDPEYKKKLDKILNS